jgi:hypothetical protein
VEFRKSQIEVHKLDNSQEIILKILVSVIYSQCKAKNWIGTPRARGREEDQRRPGGGQLWKRHREKE